MDLRKASYQEDAQEEEEKQDEELEDGVFFLNGISNGNDIASAA